MKTLHNRNDTTVPVAESDVVGAVTKLLVGERYRVRHEVPNMGQSVDIVATRGSWLTCVEAKVGKWRRALAQCLAHEQVADFICIAIAAESAGDELLREVSKSGYGLIVYRPSNRSCDWARPPDRNAKVWRPQRRRLMSLMRKIAYAH
ncbi:MAG: hypothetical protein IMZ62_02645 [Chloroflexi bacterium]|nr:hypothetical protein [Chloroflexota bacterium]